MKKGNYTRNWLPILLPCLMPQAGCEWPQISPSNAGTLGDFIVKSKSIGKHGLTQVNVVLVFVKYYTNSTKSYMRMFRQEKNGGGRVHILTAEIPLPPKTSILGVTKNKVQLNKRLAGAMVNPNFYRHATAGQMHSRTVASTEDVPVEIVGATVFERSDLEITRKLIQ